MKNNETIWAKTLLSSYSYLERICNGIDKAVLNFGLHSKVSNSTEFVANQIIQLTERKKTLINTKVLIDDILNRIDLKHSKILVLKYIDRMKADTASKLLKISLRTYFRKINIAVDEFTNQLQKFGYYSLKLKSIFADENWILEIYNTYQKKNFKEVDLQSLNLLGIALNSFKKRVVSSCQ